MTALQDLLATFRATAKTEREKGNYFERLVKVYLLNEPLYKDMFGGKVYLWEEWRKHWMSLGNADPQSDAGIDLVAVEDVADNPRIFAIQAKFYAEDAKIKKSDGIDSFLSALGKAPFTNGMLFMTSYEASHHVIEAVQGRDKPVNIIDLITLENSKIDWAEYAQKEKVTFKESKQLRDYQRKAIANVTVGLQYANRGKLIMACGTGKTFTSLRMAEELVGAGGRVLFLVPSLSLLSQTLTEWTQESAVPLHSFAVCSDGEVGKRRDKDDDFELLAHELQYPATTQSSTIAREVSKRHDDQHMSVVFSTYHSIDVISQAQLQHGLAEFDLIICDEAHRTTGATYRQSLIELNPEHPDVVSQLNSFVRDLADRLVKQIEEVIVTLNDKLTVQLGDNFKRLNDAVNNLVIWQNNYKEQLPKHELPLVIASARNWQMVLLARLDYWQDLNHAYREQYRSHRDAEDAATKAHWEQNNPDNRTWWQKLRGVKPPSYLLTNDRPFTFPSFQPTIEQRENMQALIELIGQEGIADKYKIELAELHRELGKFDDAQLFLSRLSADEQTPTSRHIKNMVAKQVSAPIRFSM